MARPINRLSARFVQTVSKAGYYPDGGGLYLQVTATGAKSWIFRYRLGAKRPEMGLGSTLALSLAQARESASNARRARLEGRDPMAERSAMRAARQAVPTFEQARDTYISDHKAGWRNPKHVAQWENTLETYAAKLNARPVDTIDTPDIVAVLKPIWRSIPETASRVRGRLERILDAEIVKQNRAGPNPARWKGNLQHLLPARDAAVKHLAALPYEDAPAFYAALRREQGQAARALEWLLLNANRPGEVRFADAGEFIGDIWTVPASRMKAKRDHVIPLSAAAVAMRKTLPAKGLLFPHEYTGEPLSENAMTALLDRMGYKGRATAHGFRSTFKDWASETTTVQNEVSEMALAHRIKDKTEAAYRRGKLLAKRRELMNAWATYLGAG